jgi:hypothetical protein
VCAWRLEGPEARSQLVAGAKRLVNTSKSRRCPSPLPEPNLEQKRRLPIHPRVQHTTRCTLAVLHADMEGQPEVHVASERSPLNFRNCRPMGQGKSLLTLAAPNLDVPAQVSALANILTKHLHTLRK